MTDKSPSASSATLVGVPDWVREFTPVTPLAKRLWAIRLELERLGGATMTGEEIDRQVRELREKSQ